MTKEKKVVFGRLGLMRNDTLSKNKKIKIFIWVIYDAISSVLPFEYLLSCLRSKIIRWITHWMGG